MVTSDSFPDSVTDDMAQPMRREQDRISMIDGRIRARLLGDTTVRQTAPLPDPFAEMARMVVADLALGMQEVLVEVWLRDVAPWGGSEDDATPELRCVAAMALLRPSARRRPSQPVPEVIQAVMVARRPVRYDEPADHPLVRSWVTNAGLQPEIVATFLGFPLLVDNVPIGVLAVALPITPTSEHATFAGAIAQYLAIAADRARLRHRLESRQTLAAQALQALPPGVLVLRASDETILLTNPSFDMLFQLHPSDWGLRLGEALPDHAGYLRQMLRLDDVRRSGVTRHVQEQAVKLATGATYWDFLCAPLVDDAGEVQAMVVLGVDVTMQSVRRQQQHQTIEVAQARLGQLVELHRIAVEVAAQLGQDPFHLIQTILERTITLFAANGGMICIADRETGDLDVALSMGLARDYTGMALPRGVGLLGRVAVTGESQRVDDYQAYPMRSTVLQDPSFRSMAAAPLKQRNRVIGVICLIKTDHPPTRLPDDDVRLTFDKDDLWLLELFALQAAQAIEHGRTFQELERAYQQQRALDRQKDDFIARISHDLRIPLTNVIGGLEVALQYLPADLDPTLRELLQQADGDAQRMRELMEEMLAQAQMENDAREVHLRAVALAPVLVEIVEARRKQGALLGLPHSFSIEVEQDLVAQADLTRLKEILENLLSNAVKYSPSGGDIRVQAGADADRSHARILVSDHGLGISPEMQTRIFERFTRAPAAASEISGTGLGLYLARQLAAGMHAAVTLEASTPDEGSMFAITLPLAGE